MEVEDKIDLMSFEPAQTQSQIIPMEPDMTVISAARAA